MTDPGPSRPSNPLDEGFSYRSLLRNYISLTGLALAAVSLANIILLFLIDITAAQPSPYTGILAYMVLPAFLALGLLLTFFGIWRERKRRLAAVPGTPILPRIDLNQPGQRTRLACFLAFVLVFVLLSAVGSYRAYEFTDSTTFCGELCHTVMHPEAVAHDHSAHARVSCVECHVGSGASWYVKSKLSGARQVIKTILGTYPRPIESPVANLRPASQTCEQCHWPRRFWGAQLKVFNHFGSDENNTPRQIRLLIKTGGGDPSMGQSAGIHWHMNIANKIEYKSDAKRQSIAWVRITDMKGNVTEYEANGADASKTASMAQRRMDCVDCHNRPTHVYMPPDRAVDQAMAAGLISPTLPFAKAQSVAVLTAEYKTTDQAVQAITQTIPAFYKEKYPQIAASRAGEIQAMVSQLQHIFKENIFPEMKVDWRTHPDNVGHYYFNGCFRCHDGNHVSKDGKVISKECNSCHTVLSQEEGTLPAGVVNTAMSFKHPIDLGDLGSVNCSDCHNGGVGP
ncbi:MAG: cytochrome c3 family protein [Acidobacteriota bacterium]|nr:cytochrome c3 family protein [Acidobacteriota bacterium]